MNGFGVSPLEIMASEAMLRGIAFCDEFVYSASWITGTGTALGSLATVDAQIQINGDSDFIAQEMNITAFDNAGPPTVIVANPNLLLTVTRSGSGREVMNGPQHVMNICGGYSTSHFPAKKPMPGLYNKSNNITLKLQNLSTTVFSRVDISLLGFKVFYITNALGQTGDRQSIFHAM